MYPTTEELFQAVDVLSRVILNDPAIDAIHFLPAGDSVRVSWLRKTSNTVYNCNGVSIETQSVRFIYENHPHGPTALLGDR
jgi:hypothetical protein